MKKYIATVLIAGAALVAPTAVGQSQRLALDPVRDVAGTAQAVQTQATTFFAPRQPMLSGSLDSDKPAMNPDPLTSWLMALAVLGIIAIRRTRMR
jgi:hypothetical protein